MNPLPTIQELELMETLLRKAKRQIQAEEFLQAHATVDTVEQLLKPFHAELEPVTHAIWTDTPRGLFARTCCGVLRRRDEAVVEPTCVDCQAALKSYEELALDRTPRKPS
jgi:hypothetical protein